MKTSYKFLDLDNNGKLRSHYGDHEWTIGTVYEISGEIELCSHGFHASERIIDAINCVHGNILAIVEGSGDRLSKDNKVVWRNMRILRAYHWTPEDSVALAIFAAESVLPLYESWAPGDHRPRQAIEIARTAAGAVGAAYAADAAARAAAAAVADAAYAAYAAYAVDAALAALAAADADRIARAADAAVTYAARAAARAADAAVTYAARAAAYSARAAARAALADRHGAAEASAAAVTHAVYSAAYCAAAKADISAYATATGADADAAKAAVYAKMEEWLVQHAATLRPYTPTKECG